MKAPTLEEVLAASARADALKAEYDTHLPSHGPADLFRKAKYAKQFAEELALAYLRANGPELLAMEGERDYLVGALAEIRTRMENISERIDASLGAGKGRDGG